MSYRHSVTGQTTAGGRKKARLTARPRRRGDRVKFRRREGLVTKSPIVKRSVKIDGRKTSVCLEDAFWTALKEIAAHQNISVETLVRSRSLLSAGGCEIGEPIASWGTEG